MAVIGTLLIIFQLQSQEKKLDITDAIHMIAVT
jgi:hypothetical protein